MVIAGRAGKRSKSAPVLHFNIENHDKDVLDPDDEPTCFCGRNPHDVLNSWRHRPGTDDPLPDLSDGSVKWLGG